jgi:CubicO group peptidase (beta-lactamase class C family)
MAGASLENWLDPPHNRRSFQAVDSIVATVPIGRGTGPVREFARAEVDIDGVAYRGAAGDSTIGGFLERAFTDGILVLRGETIVCERFLNGLTPSARHILMSISKGFAGVLAGTLVTAGRLGPDESVADVVPELAGSGYAAATVQQVLDMSASIAFREDYDDPTAEVQAQDRVAGWRPAAAGDPPTSKAFLAGLEPSGPHGARFQYCSATTDALAWLLERRSGLAYAELLERSLWSRIGAADDAFITVDSEGFPFANAGLCVTMPDLARFGRLVLDGGSWRGNPIVPADWLAEMRSGAGCPIATAEEPGEISATFPDATYHDQWWITRNDRGVVFGIGIFGQFLWLDPTSDVVIVKLSSWPIASEPDLVREHLVALGALAEAVG